MLNTRSDNKGEYVTEEGKAIAAAVDQFPRFVRERMVRSMMKVVEVYSATTLKEYQRIKEKPVALSEPLPDNVIQIKRGQG